MSTVGEPEEVERDPLLRWAAVAFQVAIYGICALVAFAAGGATTFAGSEFVGYGSVLGVTAFVALFFFLGAFDRPNWWKWLLLYVGIWFVLTFTVVSRVRDLTG